jgi:hypothetical protein
VANGVLVTPRHISGIREGLIIYRYRDHLFLRQLERSRTARETGVRFHLETSAEGFVLRVLDEDGNIASAALIADKEIAAKRRRAIEITREELAKTGATLFGCRDVELESDQPCFLPVSTLNSLRRKALGRLLAVRALNRLVMRGEVRRNQVPHPESALTYRGNMLNEQAAAFYQRHGVSSIEPASRLQ